MPVSKPFYCGTYSYRKLPVLVVSIVLILVWLAATIRVLGRAEKMMHSKEAFCIELALLSSLAFFGWIGFRMLHYYFTSKVLELQISSEGVSLGDKFYPWEEIRDLELRGEACGHLVLHRRGFLALDRHLMTDEPMSLARYEVLMERLEQHVAPGHEHLSFR